MAKITNLSGFNMYTDESYAAWDDKKNPVPEVDLKEVLAIVPAWIYLGDRSRPAHIQGAQTVIKHNAADVFTTEPARELVARIVQGGSARLNIVRLNAAANEVQAPDAAIVDEFLKAPAQAGRIKVVIYPMHIPA